MEKDLPNFLSFSCVCVYLKVQGYQYQEIMGKHDNCLEGKLEHHPQHVIEQFRNILGIVCWLQRTFIYLMELAGPLKRLSGGVSA